MGLVASGMPHSIPDSRLFFNLDKIVYDYIVIEQQELRESKAPDPLSPDQFTAIDIVYPLISIAALSRNHRANSIRNGAKPENICPACGRVPVNSTSEYCKPHLKQMARLVGFSILDNNQIIKVQPQQTLPHAS